MNFVLSMTDGISGPAKAGAQSLSTLDAQLKAETKTLSVLESQLRAMKASGSSNAGIMAQMTGQIDEQKLKIGNLTQEMIKNGGAGKEVASAEKEIGEAAGTAAPRLGAMAKAVSGVAVAIVGTVAATALLATGFAALGAETSEAKGDVTRSLELLYGSQEAAENTYRAIEGITSRVAMSQSRALELSDTLIKAGEVNGDRMIRSIEAIGKAEAARKGAGQVLEGVITRASSTKMFSISRQELRAVGLSYRDMAQEISKQTGKGVAETEIMLRTGGVRVKEGLDALSKVVDSKLGALADRKFMTVGNQTERLKDNFKRLFEGFDTGPFARALKKIADLLDESSSSGSALRTFLKAAFDDIGKVVEWLAPYVSLFFDGMTLAALKVYNALYPLRKALKDTFGGDNGTQDFQNVMLSLADDIGTFAGKAANFLADLIRNWDALWQTFDEIMSDPLHALAEGAGDLGKMIIDGLIDGLKSGVGAVGDAFKNMAHSGLSSFKEVLGIHSPSKVMAEQGEFLNEGLAQGVERSAGRPADAMAGTAGAMPGAAAGGAGRGGAGGGFQVVFNAGAIVVQGTGITSAQESELRARLSDLMADVFEQAALMGGQGAAA